MNNPAAMNEMMRAMRSPTLRREMMRNTDRMMSNIESMPGGFNELRKIYHSIQEPMEDALENLNINENSQNNQQRNNHDTTPNTEALPNPWARPTSQNSSNMFGQNNNPMYQNLLNNPQFMNQVSSSSTGQNTVPLYNYNYNFNPQLMNQLLGGMMNNNNNNNNNNNLQNQDIFDAQLMNQVLASMGNPMMLINNGLQQPNQPPTQQPTQQPTQPPTQQPTQQQFSNPFLFNPYLFGNQQNPTNYSAPINNIQPTTNSISPNPSNQTPEQPEQRYNIQISQLNEMGFTDNSKIIQALQQTHGNVERAIEILFTM